MGPGKGNWQSSEHSSFRDRVTGARIHQMTSHPSVNHPTYFLQSSFTRDSKAVFFISYRGGSAQLFEASFPDGDIRQLTDGPAIHPFSSAAHPDGQRLLFVRGGDIWAIDRSSLGESRVAAFPGAQLGECSFDASGDWIAAAIKQNSQSGLVVGRCDGTEWRTIPFSRTVIHPQFNPADPEWIEFSADPAPRMHRVRRDGRGLECLYLHGNDEFIVHETFLPDNGDLIFTVWPGKLCRFGWRTRLRTTVSEFNAWHITPNRAGTRIVCDTNHPDRGIFLVDILSGSRRLICMSDSSNQGTQWKKSTYALAADFEAARGGAAGHLSWMEASSDSVYGPQWTHPHPSFSPDERYVTFGSDRSGHAQVYVVELDAMCGA